MPRSSITFTATRLWSPSANGRDIVPRYFSIRSGSISAFRFLASLAQPSSSSASGKEDLAGVEAAAVVVGVEEPHGDFCGVAGFDGAGAGVVVIEAADFGLDICPLSSPRILISRMSTSGRPTSQKDWLLVRFFFRSSVRRSAFIWAVRKVMPVFSLVSSSMSLAASGSNWKAAKTRISGLGWRVRASSQADFDLAGFERGVVGAEGDDDAFGFCAFGFGVGVKPAGAA